MDELYKQVRCLLFSPLSWWGNISNEHVEEWYELWQTSKYEKVERKVFTKSWTSDELMVFLSCQSNLYQEDL